MTTIAEFVTKLIEDLNKSDKCKDFKWALIRTHPGSQRAALEETIHAIRGEITAEDRACLDLISPWQLIQVICVNTTGHVSDLDAAIFKVPVTGKVHPLAEEPRVQGTSSEPGFTLRDAVPTPEVDRSLRNTFTPKGLDSGLFHLAVQFRNALAPSEQQFLVGVSEEVVEKGLQLPPGMTVAQLLKYGLDDSVRGGYLSGLIGLHERMMASESRSASASLLPRPALKDSKYFHMIDGRDSSHPDHPFNQVSKMKGLVRDTVYGSRIPGTPEIALLLEKIKPFPEAPFREFPSLPGTIEDEIPPLPEAFVKKVEAKGGRITMFGIVYQDKTAENPEERDEVNRKNQIHARYVETYHNMSMSYLTEHRDLEQGVLCRLVPITLESIHLALQHDPVGIMGGQVLETFIHDNPELKAMLVEDEKRYANRPMGKLRDVPLSILAQAPVFGSGSFLYVFRERLLPSHF